MESSFLKKQEIVDDPQADTTIFCQVAFKNVAVAKQQQRTQMPAYVYLPNNSIATNKKIVKILRLHSFYIHPIYQQGPQEDTIPTQTKQRASGLPIVPPLQMS